MSAPGSAFVDGEKILAYHGLLIYEAKVCAHVQSEADMAPLYLNSVP